MLDYLDSDNLAPYEVVRLGWQHELLSLKDGFYDRWADLQLYQDAWVDSSSLLIPDPHFFSQARLHPARWLSLDVQAKVNTDTGELYRSASGFSLLDGFKNEISVHYLAYDQGNDSLQTQFMHILLMNRRVYLDQSGTTRRSGHFRIGLDCSQYANLLAGNGLFICLNEEGLQERITYLGVLV